VNNIREKPTKIEVAVIYIRTATADLRGSRLGVERQRLVSTYRGAISAMSSLPIRPGWHAAGSLRSACMNISAARAPLSPRRVMPGDKSHTVTNRKEEVLCPTPKQHHPQP
jgi:hypothetical protein